MIKLGDTVCTDHVLSPSYNCKVEKLRKKENGVLACYTTLHCLQTCGNTPCSEKDVSMVLGCFCGS